MKKAFTFLIFHCTFPVVNYLHAQAPGSLDTSFDPGTGANRLVHSIVLQPDGKILIAGYFTEYNGTPRNRIARLNADGSLDASFDPGTGATGTATGSNPIRIDVMSLQPDGKILIGGYFTEYNGTSRNCIARLHTDGSLDTSFDPGTGVTANQGTASISSLTLQPDGKILIGGYFSAFNGTDRNRIARLNANGSLDATFDPGIGANSHPSDLPLQSDGKIICAGFFTQFNGATHNNIVRLNMEGTLDTGFNEGTGTDNGILCVSVQPDDKILIGGYFYSYNNTTRAGIARLNANGSLDTTFNMGTGLAIPGGELLVMAIALLPDGKILISGNFTSYNGTPINYIARLNADGSLDTSFDPGTGTGYYKSIHSFALQPDGRILMGGAFTEYNGTARNYIARIHGTPTTGIHESAALHNVSLYPNPAGEQLFIDTEDYKNATAEVFTIQGQLRQSVSLQGVKTTLQIAELPAGIYLLQIKTEKGVGTGRLVKE